ncbi:MAG TPA: LuxR C-terminal-related transcriptional regulator [Thermoanaerobaculia bacterium]
MTPLQILKTSIENLQCSDLLRQKQEMLTIIDTLSLSGNGNGNGHSFGSNGETHHLRLSPREREVMGMILSGRRLKEIAATLDISVKTVTTHRSRLLRKLGIEDNLGLFRYGVRNGLISV